MYDMALIYFSCYYVLLQFLTLEAIGGLKAILEARSKQRQMLRVEQQQKSKQLP